MGTAHVQDVRSLTSDTGLAQVKLVCSCGWESDPASELHDLETQAQSHAADILAEAHAYQPDTPDASDAPPDTPAGDA